MGTTMNTIRRSLAGSLPLLLLCVVGCKAEVKPTAPAIPPAAAAAVAPEVLAQLAKADAKDGKVDKIVHKCAGCALGMDGKAEFALPVQDYTMHFCKQGCLDGFKTEPSKAILALKIKD